MIDLFKERLEEIQPKIDMALTVFDVEKLNFLIEEINKEIEKNNFTCDEVVGKKLKSLQQKKVQASTMIMLKQDLVAILDMLQVEIDEDLVLEFEKIYDQLYELVESCIAVSLLGEEYDNADAVVTLHAGAGGTESQDFAEMLFRMYCRFATKNNFKISVLDTLVGDGVGYKSISFAVEGENAYGLLKCEKGVHRLVRISPFDSNKRRHTSFASVDVVPEIENDNGIEIAPEDIRIDTFRSSGAGGQHVNTTESAIRITHLKTNVVVSCQNERSQLKNKETAMKMLMGKLLQIKKQQNLDNINDIKGEQKKIEWGSQIRSYVFCPYTKVKDHRTNFETSSTSGVMDGNIMPFINEFLVFSSKNRME